MMQRLPLHSVAYGTTHIAYDVAFSRRKTLAIQVYPDGRVSVRAPQGSTRETIAGVVSKRAGWIVKQQQRFRSYAPPTVAPREYVSGESYRYLGRQYRLKVLDGTPSVITLGRTDMVVTVRNKEPQRVQRLLEQWYRAEAQRIFHERMRICLQRVAHLGVAFPPLTIRRMKRRWGSCSRDGRIILNLRLIQAPVEYIDYVIVHELCHLQEHNHSKRYYALLDAAMPDWREWRQRLNTYEFV
jgi:predicted metal-dependent hydrolase